jgi:hypothetical protein
MVEGEETLHNSEKLTIQRNWQHKAQKTKKNKVTTQSNKTWALLQTSGGKDEPNIVLMQKS